jgi:vacuolar-type H+-ATPase subunit H
MATQEPGRPREATLTALPRAEDLPVGAQGYDQERVQEAFETFRRHATQLQAQLRVLQAAGTRTEGEPSGHAVRMDSLHLIRAAAEFADSIERDAQEAAAVQIGRAESEISEKHRELQKHEAHIDQLDQEAKTQRDEMLKESRKEASEILTKADRDAKQQISDAEARGTQLLEQARHEATQLTNAARAEFNQSREWANAEAARILTRAREGAEQLLSASGLGSQALDKVVKAIMGSIAEAEKAEKPASGGGSGEKSGS